MFYNIIKSLITVDKSEKVKA